MLIYLLSKLHNNVFFIKKNNNLDHVYINNIKNILYKYLKMCNYF